MKSIMALVALVFAFSISAHAQARTQAAGGGSNVNRGNGSGSASGGGTSGGSVTFNTPAHTPTTQFQMAAASGSSDYVPSTYLAYDNAVTAGQAALTSKSLTVAEAAQANTQAKGAESQYVIVQDKRGNLVEESRK